MQDIDHNENDADSAKLSRLQAESTMNSANSLENTKGWNSSGVAAVVDCILLGIVCIAIMVMSKLNVGWFTAPFFLLLLLPFLAFFSSASTKISTLHLAVTGHVIIGILFYVNLYFLFNSFDHLCTVKEPTILLPLDLLVSFVAGVVFLVVTLGITLLLPVSLMILLKDYSRFTIVDNGQTMESISKETL